VLWSTLQQRVQELKQEISELRKAFEIYGKVPHQSPAEMLKQLQRELRLQQIIDELAALMKKRAE